jgi:hypothetical protein
MNLFVHFSFIFSSDLMNELTNSLCHSKKTSISETSGLEQQKQIEKPIPDVLIFESSEGDEESFNLDLTMSHPDLTASSNVVKKNKQTSSATGINSIQFISFHFVFRSLPLVVGLHYFRTVECFSFIINFLCYPHLFVLFFFSSGNVSVTKQQSTRELKDKDKKEIIERNLRSSNMPYKDRNNQEESSEEMQDRSKNKTDLQSEESV